MKYIKDFITELLPSISNKNLKLVLEDSKQKKLKKGEVISPKGEVPKYFYLLKSGIARSFVIDANNREHIKALYLAPDICGSLIGLVKQEVSDVITDCITDCEIFIFDYVNFKKRAQTNLELSLLNLKVIETVAIRNDNRIEDLTTLDATEHYLRLKKQIPNIDNLIQQYHIASYLNITPVQLSRIRKKLYSK